MSSKLDKNRGSMHRYVQFNCYKDQMDHLEWRAREDGVSVSEIIRQLIDEDIAAEMEAATPEDEGAAQPLPVTVVQAEIDPNEPPVFVYPDELLAEDYGQAGH